MVTGNCSVWISSSSDLKFVNFRLSATNFESFSWSLEHFSSQLVRTILVTKYHLCNAYTNYFLVVWDFQNFKGMRGQRVRVEKFNKCWILDLCLDRELKNVHSFRINFNPFCLVHAAVWEKKRVWQVPLRTSESGTVW